MLEKNRPRSQKKGLKKCSDFVASQHRQENVDQMNFLQRTNDLDRRAEGKKASN